MTAAQQDSKPKGFDLDGVDVLRNHGSNGHGAFTRPCGSLPSEPSRWHVASVAPTREALALARLDHLGFAAFVPLVVRRVRHARRDEVVNRPLFPRYVFVAFDPTAERWRRAHGVGLGFSLFGPDPEHPAPLPRGFVERWIAEGWDKPITRDLAPDLIAAGARVEVTDGPFCDHEGVCLWSDGTRARVLLSLLGRQVEATLAREKLRQVAS